MSRDERHDADGEVVWSWRPDAGAKLAENDPLMRWQESPVTGPVTGESTKETVKTIRAGKAGCSGCTCGSAACFLVARGPWVSADTRPSLRPLISMRVIQMQSSDAPRRENAGLCFLCCLQIRSKGGKRVRKNAGS
jgi:hypothetical protein